jgi:capsule biosynthesis phosphatase
MRICIDMDGTICKNRSPDQKYSDIDPIEGAVTSLRNLKNQGHYIIIDTARHVRTCNWNEGQIIARQAKVLINWLDKHGIPYDEIWFSKPLADVYIDDKGMKFNSWDEVIKTIGGVTC